MTKKKEETGIALTQKEKIEQAIESIASKIDQALPSLGVTRERLSRVFLNQIMTDNKLKPCTPASICTSIMDCAELGLEPGGKLGHMYLVPYKNKAAGTVECQAQLGYKGMLALVRRSNQVLSVSCDVVYDADDFKHKKGLKEDLVHERSDRPEKDWGEITHSYFIVRFLNGGHHIEVMTIEEINKHKNRSPAVKFKKKDSPWFTDPESMIKKTVIRAAFKYLPATIVPPTAIKLADDDDFEGETINAAPVSGRHKISPDEDPPSQEQLPIETEAVAEGQPEGEELDPETVATMFDGDVDQGDKS